MACTAVRNVQRLMRERAECTASSREAAPRGGILVEAISCCSPSSWGLPWPFFLRVISRLST